MTMLRRDGGRGAFPRRMPSDERSRLDQSIFPQSRSPFPRLFLTASAYVEMNRTLVLVAVLALAVAGCSQSQPAPTPTPTLGCPEPTRVTGLTPFDVENRATWQKDLAAGIACEPATLAYVERLEEEKERQLFANASSFAVIGRVTDAATGAPLDQVCITPGKPGQICWARTDKDGWYLLDLGAVFAKEGFFEIFFVKTGYPEQHNTSRLISGRPRLDYQMTK
jgi:hypothetical protein